MDNVADLVAAAAASGGDRPALMTAEHTLTWSEVDARVTAAARRLRGAGVERGDRVGLLLPNGLEFPVACWGALRAGATVVPVNPTYTVPEVAHILDDAGIRHAVVHPALAGLAAAAAPGASLLTAATGWWRSASGDGDADAPTAPADDAVVCYTSGTTGRPKGARLGHRHLLANLAAFCTLPHLTLTAADVLLGVLPFFHIFGLNCVLGAAARHGAAVLILDRFSPAGSLAAMAAAGVSVAYGAPPMFAAWNAVPPADRPALPRLRAAVSGADALPVATWKGFLATFDVEIREGYGLTETSPVLASTAASPTLRPGTVGHAIPGVDLRVVDPAGADREAGTVGEIVARGPGVFSGYLGQPAATAESMRGGWFHTGDLGAIAADGTLTISGRLTDLVIVSGFNVYPREVEEALLAHPDVADAAVLGVPDARTGERVHAVVVSRGGTVDVEALRAHCRERLARYKIPRDIAVIAALPRTATGKVVKSALVDVVATCPPAPR